jgi:predicted enzyme related to lactoylglutathione lyase
MMAETPTHTPGTFCWVRALELGGSLQAPAMDVPGVGRFGWVSDPLGATFSVIALVER